MDETPGKATSPMFHYTNDSGYKAISSSPEWLFCAAQPPGDPKAHPFGAYFTDLPENEPMLARKLRIPKEKLRYVFAFIDAGISTGSVVIEVGTSSTLG